MSDTTRPLRDNDSSLEWMRQVQIGQRGTEESSGVLRNIYKRAKTDGENVDAMRRAIRKLRSRSPEEIIADLQDEIRFLQLRKVEITPATLFGNMDLTVSQNAQHKDDLWDAADRGYRDGRLNRSIEDCPYLPGTELHQEYAVHLAKGKTAAEREAGPGEKIASTARRRPRQERIAGTEDRQDSPQKAKRKAAAGSGKARGRPKGSKNKSKGNGRKRAALPAPTNGADTSPAE